MSSSTAFIRSRRAFADSPTLKLIRSASHLSVVLFTFSELCNIPTHVFFFCVWLFLCVDGSRIWPRWLTIRLPPHNRCSSLFHEHALSFSLSFFLSSPRVSSLALSLTNTLSLDRSLILSHNPSSLYVSLSLSFARPFTPECFVLAPPAIIPAFVGVLDVYDIPNLKRVGWLSVSWLKHA